MSYNAPIQLIFILTNTRIKSNMESTSIMILLQPPYSFLPYSAVIEAL